MKRKPPQQRLDGLDDLEWTIAEQRMESEIEVIRQMFSAWPDTSIVRAAKIGPEHFAQDDLQLIFDAMMLCCQRNRDKVYTFRVCIDWLAHNGYRDESIRASFTGMTWSADSLASLASCSPSIYPSLSEWCERLKHLAWIQKKSAELYRTRAEILSAGFHRAKLPPPKLANQIVKLNRLTRIPRQILKDEMRRIA